MNVQHEYEYTIECSSGGLEKGNPIPFHKLNMKD